MIRSFLHTLAQAQSRTGLSRRARCARLSYSTVLRWSRRQRQGMELLQKPGPKKKQPPDWTVILSQVKSLDHGRRRSHGATALYQEHQREVSRRQLQQLVQQERDRQLDHMKRIHWLRPGTAWSIDATHYQGSQLVPLHDLASRYRFAPLVSSREEGVQIAAFLDHAFRENGAPLLLKRDNGSPFNCEQVNAVLAQHGVLPLNSPPHYPRYNGAMEKSIGDFKRRLCARLLTPVEDRLLAVAVEATTHELNHRARRCLNGKTACEIYHHPDLRLRLMAAEDPHALATVWRVTVQTWLVRQGLITVGLNSKPNPKVSTIFPQKWSHN